MCVFSVALIPYAMYYGMAFLMFELSTPFVTGIWLLEKAELSGSALHTFAGVMLGVTFFLSRLVWGVWKSVEFWVSIGSWYSADISWGILITLLVGNVSLTLLNVVWFHKIVKSIMKRLKWIEAKDDSDSQDLTKSSTSIEVVAVPEIIASLVINKEE
jgi:hypothetical protein